MSKHSILPLAALALCLSLAGQAQAQRARTVSEPAKASPTPAPPPAPPTITAKYEGGITGFMKKQTGTLNFNDEERRLVFRDKQGREYLSIPYKSIAGIWGDTKAQRTTAGSVVGAIPLPYGVNMLGLLMREKRRYLVLQFQDPDTQAQGVTSFKLPSKELLASAIYTLGQKADLTQRGEAYIRLNKEAKDSTKTSQP